MKHASSRHHRRRAVAAAGAALLAAGVALVGPAGPAQAASSTGCEGGGFTVLGRSGATDTTVTAPPATFRVQGRYVQFTVVAATFEVRDYDFLPTDNKVDMTGGVLTPVWASKLPQHGGSLTSAVTLSLPGDAVNLRRTGTLASGQALDMKIQAKDCAAGGIFQMEVGRGDGAKTRFVHTLAGGTRGPAPFYFDNASFRERIGEYLTADENGDTVTCVSGSSRFCVQVSARTNIGNDFSEDFVGRDSPQGDAAPENTVRVPDTACGSTNVPSIAHCGGVSVWQVASGGRMGFVTGEDSVEVAPPPSLCVENCQAQNQVRGRLAVLGFPFPVLPGDRLRALP